MNLLIRLTTLFFLLLGLAMSGVAQRYPATTSLQLLPPYSVNLEDYASPGIDRTFISAVFNDFSQSSWEVKFRLTISNGNVILQTNPNMPFPAIRLEPGQLEQFTGADLAEYFNYNNMLLSGIDRASIQENGGLPEGMYTFTVEILDHRTGTPISNKGSAMATLFLNDPPQLSLPANNTRIIDTDPQNILFQWLPMHQGSPNSAFTTSYELTITEVHPGLNPEEAMRAALPIFQGISDVNNYFYDIGSPLLEQGKSYAYRIRAIDADNLGLFKNNGYSDVGFFEFGVNTYGAISLISPANEAIVQGDSRLVFQWDAPNNLSFGQHFQYTFKIVKLEENQALADALLTNAPFYEEEFLQTTSSFGYSFKLPIPLEAETQYAWQVTAATGETEVAVSVPSLLNSAPKLGKFNAGQHVVSITSLSNKDVNNISGKGTVQLAEDGTQYAVAFDGLKLKALGGKLFLESGSITQLLPDNFPKIILSPTTEVNGEAVFHAERIYLDRNNLKIEGYAQWPLPFPIESGEMAYVTTVKKSLIFDNYKLNGTLALNNSNSFQLIDPYGFDLTLKPSSTLFLYEDTYKQNFDVALLLPESVKSAEGGRIMAKLTKAEQLFTNKITLLEQPIIPIEGINIQLLPTLAHIDLSTSQSPGDFSADKYWMGLYFEKFDIRFLKDIDQQQLTFDEIMTHSFVASTGIKAWTDGEGLRMELKKDFAATTTDFIRFNKFHGKIKTFHLAVKQSLVQSGEIKGSISIPLLNDESFDYLIPISNEGFEVGHLAEALSGKEFSLGTAEKDKVNMVLGQAIFAENERLDLSISLAWPGLGFDIRELHDFKIWGNGQIGFEKPYGAQALPQQAAGVLNGYDLLAHTVSAGFANSNYYFGLTSTINIDEDLSGLNGPPETTLYTLKASPIVEDKSWVKPVEISNYTFVGSEGGVRRDGDIVIDSTLVTFEIGLGRAQGYIHMTENDPVWGNSFRGLLTVDVRLPITFQMTASFITGKKDDFSYYFFEGGLGAGGIAKDDKNLSIANRAGSNSNGNGTGKAPGTTGKSRVFKKLEGFGDGIALGALSIIAGDFRFYKKMSHTDSVAVQEGGGDIEIAFLPDANNSYGIYGRVAGRDLATQGGAFNFDAAFEYSETTGGASRYAFEGNVEIGKSASNKAGSGSGKFIYDESKELFHGAVWIIMETEALCAEGGLAITMSPDYWQLNIGSEDQKIKIVPACKGFLATGFVEITADSISLGLGFGREINLESKEINILGNKFVGKVDAGFVVGLTAKLQYEPDLALLEAGIWLEAWAAISVDYDTWFESGNMVLASANIKGNAIVYFRPIDQERIVGTLAVEVEIIGIEIAFDMGMDYAL